MDFTLNKYLEILTELIRCGYEFQTFASFIKNPKTKAVILRHDVDLLPKNSLAFARLQSERNIHGVYYFRSVPQSWDENIIKEISEMGHEIGYHYECLTTHKGNLNLALTNLNLTLTSFEKLPMLRPYACTAAQCPNTTVKTCGRNSIIKIMVLLGNPILMLTSMKFYI